MIRFVLVISIIAYVININNDSNLILNIKNCNELAFNQTNNYDLFDNINNNPNYLNEIEINIDDDKKYKKICLNCIQKRKDEIINNVIITYMALFALFLIIHI